MSKACRKCNVVKPLDLFYTNNACKDKKDSWCKPCCKDGNNRSREKKYSTFEGTIFTKIMNTEKETFDPLDEPHKIYHESCCIKLDQHLKLNTIKLFTYPKPIWSIEFTPDCFIYTPRKYD